MSDDLKWLTKWYSGQCDGDWEHSYGIHLGTLDNPGWHLTIDLIDTALEQRLFMRREHNLNSDVSWWVCEVKDNKFVGHCGPQDLLSVLAVFRAWAEGEES